MTALRFIDWFAGVGGIRLGFERAGHRCVWSCELDAFARQVYAARFGREPEASDIRAVEPKDIPEADLWTAGFPCQDLSAAGKRKGIDGERSGLVWKLLELAAESRPGWILLENVPGLFSVDEGRGFGRLLARLDELGYVGAWRVLDARFFGVPQRRRRVFILAGRVGAGRDPARVLLEPEGVRGDLEACRAEGSRAPGGSQEGARDGELAGTLGGSSGGCGFELDRTGAFIPEDMAQPITAREQKGPDSSSSSSGNVVAVPRLAATLTSGGTFSGSPAGRRTDDMDNLIAFEPTQLTHPENRSKCEPGAPAPALAALARAPHIAYSVTPEYGQGADLRLQEIDIDRDMAPSATGTDGAKKTERGLRIATEAAVRRLTPRECERLQGLPDDWTLVAGASDGKRYKAIGNGVAVPVLEWIARRLAL